MDGLYPLKFKPILKQRIWGGDKLQKIYGKVNDFNGLPIGESWELSSVDGDISVVTNGYLEGNNLQELIEVYMGDLVGDKVYERFGVEFPLLIKLIDATSDLSVQVHPNDALAMERHHAWGKTEFWHILESDPGSYLIAGFSEPISKQQYLDALKEKVLGNILQYHKVKKGDSMFIPAGIVHAIGKGIVLAEIQQTSDITYRIYDWDRVDESGKGRDLHTELAIDAIDFDAKQEVLQTEQQIIGVPNRLISNQYFCVNRLFLEQPIEISNHNVQTFRLYLCLDGELSINYSDNQFVNIRKGELVLVPALLDNYYLKPKNKSILLEIFIN